MPRSRSPRSLDGSNPKRRRSACILLSKRPNAGSVRVDRLEAGGGFIPAPAGCKMPFDGEKRTMRRHFFDVTLRILHHDQPAEVALYKGAGARDEITARRVILNQFFNRGFRVVRLDRVQERCLQAGND